MGTRGKPAASRAAATPPKSEPKPERTGFGPVFVLESRGEGMSFCTCCTCGAVVLAELQKLHVDTHA